MTRHLRLSAVGGRSTLDKILTRYRLRIRLGSVSLDCEAMLRGAQLRVTRPRLGVLAAVHAHPHSPTESLIAAVRRDLPSVSHQAVYDVLRVLTDARLVRRIQPAGVTARYEPERGDNHHHAVCRRCAAIADVPCVVGEDPCLGSPPAFAVDHAEVVFWGLCPPCETASR